MLHEVSIKKWSLVKQIRRNFVWSEISYIFLFVERPRNDQLWSAELCQKSDNTFLRSCFLPTNASVLFFVAAAWCRTSTYKGSSIARCLATAVKTGSENKMNHTDQQLSSLFVLYGCVRWTNQHPVRSKTFPKGKPMLVVHSRYHGTPQNHNSDKLYISGSNNLIRLRKTIHAVQYCLR